MQAASYEPVLRSITGLLPDSRYFIDYAFLGTDISLTESYNGCDFLIPTERVGSTAVIHPRTFAGDLYSESNATLEKGDVLEIFDRLQVTFKSLGLTDLQFKGLPTYISGIHDAWLEEYSSEEIQTSVVHVDDYHVSNRRKRNIQKGSLLEFRYPVVDESEIERGWEELLKFLRSRQLNGLDVERVKYLTSTFPHNFSIAMVLDQNLEVRALAFTNQIGSCLRLPNYFSTQNSPGAIDFLIDSLIQTAKGRGLSTVDLGISTDPNTGSEVEGIVQFKSEFSATRKVIKRYSKTIT